MGLAFGIKIMEDRGGMNRPEMVASLLFYD